MKRATRCCFNGCVRMSDQTKPLEAEIEQASTQLAQGLESCRAVLKNYQAMIGEALEAANDTSEEELDRSSGSVA